MGDARARVADTRVRLKPAAPAAATGCAGAGVLGFELFAEDAIDIYISYPCPRFHLRRTNAEANNGWARGRTHAHTAHAHTTCCV